MDRLRVFFNSRLFDYRFRFRVHMVQLFLVIIIIALSVGKIATYPAGRPTGRSNIIAISMGAKSIVLIAYQILTSHIQRFKRWRSIKAYAIINSLEVLFWSGVAGLTFQGISRNCVGTSCVFSWLVLAVTSTLMIPACIQAAVVSIADRRYQKKTGLIRGEAPAEPNVYETESTVLPTRSYRK